jgi:hypothetical protein
MLGFIKTLPSIHNSGKKINYVWAGGLFVVNLLIANLLFVILCVANEWSNPVEEPQLERKTDKLAVPIGGNAMPFAIYTHDSWGVVKVASFQILGEAQHVFSAVCCDPWYQKDGCVKGVELVQNAEDGASQRLDWFAFR